MNEQKQLAPLYEALEALVTRDTVRFHMPGHKGKPIFSAYSDIFPLDFTETYGTGNLYEGEGPIRDAEKLAASYYGVPDCHFLTGGSTQGIHAMLCAAAAPDGEIVLDRSAHKSACSACALLGLTPHFVYPRMLEPFGCGGALDLEETEKTLLAHPNARALLVVSPNYYGVIQDIPALAALCHRHGRLLLVDAAHGAHLPAVGIPSPVRAGADAAVLSAHKTLPAMGQGAFLIFNEKLGGERLREAEAMCGTSSPSYPIMASLDLARAWLEGVGRREFHLSMEAAKRICEALYEHTPFVALASAHFSNLDPCRLTVCCATAGITGHALADRLFTEHNIACEMADDRCVVFILSGADKPLDLLRLRRALVREGKSLSQTDTPPLPEQPRAERQFSVREAWFMPRESLRLEDAEGCVCARAVTPYPPGIPILWPGEKITSAHIEFLTQRCYTTIDKILVIHQKA